MIRRLLGAAIATAMFGACQAAWANDATPGESAPAQNVNFNNVPGADQDFDAPTTILGGTDYLFIAGSAFTPRTSVQSVTYPGGGCAYSDQALTTSLELPDGAEIAGVRLYYYSINPADNVGVFLTTYPGNGTSSDLLTAASTTGSGYASEYFVPSTPIVVDQFTSATVLTATMEANTRFCGMRVFYSP